MAIVCDAPAVACNNPFLQAPLTQRIILARLLCAVADNLGASVTCTDEGLRTLAAPWLCQGSVGKLQLIQAQMICDSDLDLDCSQPVCWSPLEVEAAITALTCEIVNALTV